MQSVNKRKPPVQPVHRPVVTGSWHGKDAVKLGRKVMLSLLIASVLYLVLGSLLSFGSVAVRCVFCVLLVSAAFFSFFSQGQASGQADAAFSEIMFARQTEGNPVDAMDRERCFHPAKGFFAACLGAVPFVLVALVFACLTKPVEYSLGVLPGWLQGLSRQSEFGDALRYYTNQPGMGAMEIARILVRGMVMPFVNVAVSLDNSAVLWVERLSPLLVLIAPLGFGFGYRDGLRIRMRINTGIAIGDEAKRRKERRERKRRQRSDAPQRLI